jgi:glutamate racemase
MQNIAFAPSFNREILMEKPTSASPIGIFDSGIGGLTVASAIHQLMPNENLIYFGDTAHLPYGDKSAKAIKQYALGISDFLIEGGAKCIVIACNTASSIAFKSVKNHVGKKLLVVDVINPMVQYVAKKYNNAKIGVIGTKGTINSRTYVNKITQANPSLTVSSKSTPLLAPMIEEGFFNNVISKTIIASYLSGSNIADINALVLGCTHYPLIKNEVEAFYKKKVEVIDSSRIVAQYLKEKLSKEKLLAVKASKSKNKFFVSDYTEAFEQSTRYFFKNEIHLKQQNIWQ